MKLNRERSTFSSGLELEKKSFERGSILPIRRYSLALPVPKIVQNQQPRDCCETSRIAFLRH